jgi:hypothetical protein
MGSAMAGAGQILKLLPVRMPWQAHSAANSFGIAGSIAELIAGVVVERQVSRVPVVGKALNDGVAGALWKASKALTFAGLVVSVFGKSKRAYRVGAVLGTAGAITLRFAVFHAGKASAREPRATFQLQRDQEQQRLTAALQSRQLT